MDNQATYGDVPARSHCGVPLLVRKRSSIPIVGAFVALLALAASAPALSIGGVAGSSSQPIGAVYIASNNASGNQILTFPRYIDGSLGSVQPGVSTGGLGSGPGQLLPDDPLGAQSSLIVDQDNQRLFVANAGSNDVSVLSIQGSTLTLVSRQSSDGAYPVSLALFENTLYVLNAGSNSIAGFAVDGGGHLTHLQTCALPSLPAGAQTQSPQPVILQTPGQVGFSPDGTKLLVVSKEGPLVEPGFPFSTTLGPGRIHVYDVGGSLNTVLNCGSPTTTVLPSNRTANGKMPFSFAWTAQGQLLLTEVFGATTSFGGSAVSSFALRGDTLIPVSTSVPNGQTAACWIVRTGMNVYVANNVANGFVPPNVLSRYVLNSKGQLAPNPAVAATLGTATTSPTDVALSADGRFLYQLATGSAQVWPFRIGTTGALTGLTPVADGQPAHSGQVGIATVDYQ